MTLLVGQIIPRQDTAANWTSENPVLGSFEKGYETDTGQSKTGDNVTAWNALSYDTTGGGSGTFAGLTDDPRDNQDLADYLDAKADLQSTLLTGGIISVSTIDGTGVDNDIRVTASTFFILGQGSYSAIQTDFLNIALSSAGTQRYIGLYGTTSNTISKVEGSEAALATSPTQPADTALIGYVLVSDAAISTTPDLSGYLPRADKATGAEVLAGTNDTKYITPYALNSNKTVRALFCTTSLITHTGTLTETKVYSVLIPGGSIVTGNIIELMIRTVSNGSGGNKWTRTYVNTSDSLSGATLLATSLQATTSVMHKRSFAITGATSLLGVLNTNTADSDEIGSYNSGAFITSTVNWAVDQYLILSLQLADISNIQRIYHARGFVVK